MEWTAYLLAEATSHTPGHPWNLRSPCRRERPSVPVKATLQRDDAKCERLVASDDHLYKSNEFGLLPINLIVRTVASQILTGIQRSDRFSGTLFPSVSRTNRRPSRSVWHSLQCEYYIATPVPKTLQIATSSLKWTDSARWLLYPVVHLRCKLSRLTIRRFVEDWILIGARASRTQSTAHLEPMRDGFTTAFLKMTVLNC